MSQPQTPAIAPAQPSAGSEYEPINDAAGLFRLASGVAYLNHGSFGGVPVAVQREQQRLRAEVDLNPMAFYTRGLPERIDQVRRRVAAFLGLPEASEGLALAPNATAAMQTVLNSVRFKPGEEILVTSHGYGAVLLAAERAAATTGCLVRQVEIPTGAGDDEIVDRLQAAARSGRVRLAIVDEITSPTARVFPVERACAALQALGVLVSVDGAHAPGSLPVDLSRSRADFWHGNLHKWAFTPRPCGALYVAQEHRAAVEPLIVSWQQPLGFPSAAEFGGTLDYTPWLATPVGLDLFDQIGGDRIRRHNNSLVRLGQQIVCSALDRLAESIGEGPTGEIPSQAAMACIPLPAGVADDQDAADRLRVRLALADGVEVSVNPWQGRGMVRVCAQVYNRPAEYERLAAALVAAVRSARR